MSKIFLQYNNFLSLKYMCRQRMTTIKPPYMDKKTIDPDDSIFIEKDQG